VLESAGCPPDGWKGWPGGKEFAFVLTHDVEGPEGLQNVRALAELDKAMGFRSCFNFIPEGPYRVPATLRSWLEREGFEVGVHDLRHNGKLYASREGFRSQAQQINRCLREWNVRGFRAGFMFHNLGWQHDLEIEYDASTFDTDPFEPQPDGVGTIFPFWVPAPESAPSHRPPRPGYMELPYTLPQDFTLFVVLRERGIDIWLQKLDWIIHRGGMALLDVHPDYVAFADSEAGDFRYPVAFYRGLLEKVREHYADRFWHALPREVARHVKERMAPALSTPKGVACGVAGRSETKPKVWIDLDNTPHVLLFEPIIDELRSRGFPLLVTARDAFQVCELARARGIQFIKVGRHHGRNRIRKVLGLFYRACQLWPVVRRERPALGLSHGARAQLILCNLTGLPTLMLDDYEYSTYLPLMRPTWELVPEVIPADTLPVKREAVRTYPGFKEDIYAWKLKPDPSILASLGVQDHELIVTVRPPATEAHYHDPESLRLFVRFMERACRAPRTLIVLLPRNPRQARFIRANWPAWFDHGRTIIPSEVLDGLNLIWHSDLVVSGGGTMCREAAALGVPVYSIFRGRLGAVDTALARQGRLTLIEAEQDVDLKIRLAKRDPRPLPEAISQRTLHHIVNTVVELAQHDT